MPKIHKVAVNIIVTDNINPNQAAQNTHFF